MWLSKFLTEAASTVALIYFSARKMAKKDIFQLKKNVRVMEISSRVKQMAAHLLQEKPTGVKNMGATLVMQRGRSQAKDSGALRAAQKLVMPRCTCTSRPTNVNSAACVHSKLSYLCITISPTKIKLIHYQEAVCCKH